MLFKKSIKYPIIFDTISGVTMLDDEFTSINRCIALILTSAKGELLGSPDFGSHLYELLFDPATSDSLDSVISDIVETLKVYEKRIVVRKQDITIVKNENEPNSYKITINYTLSNSNLNNSTSIYIDGREGGYMNG